MEECVHGKQMPPLPAKENRGITPECRTQKVVFETISVFAVESIRYFIYTRFLFTTIMGIQSSSHDFRSIKF
jgi:hypothetical protein